MVRTPFVCVFVAVLTATMSYNFDDPYAAHTAQAIEFDRQGKLKESAQAFEAAAHFGRSTQTLVNLGVCYMRMASRSSIRSKKVELYGMAMSAMSEGLTMARTPDDRHLFDENWSALKTNLDIEHVDLAMKDTSELVTQEEEPVYDNRQCGRPPDPADSRRRVVTEVKQADRRDFLIHQRPVPRALPLPKVSVHDIDRQGKKLQRYANRLDPFVLTGAASSWGALNKASQGPANAWLWLDRLVDLWPKAVVDFYPYNMLSQDRQSPFLTRLGRAVFELKIRNSPQQQTENASTFRYDKFALEGRYFHLQLTPEMWRQLEADTKHGLAAKRHWHLENDGWIDDCFGGDDALRTEYHLKTHWKIILAGAAGAGMFNHSDSLQTSSWHAHLAGRKWWYVCGDLSTGQRGACFESVLEPGDILYYGRGWHHETQNLETPTITITDTAIHAKNFAHVADMLHAECTRDAFNFKFSATLCDALDSCYDALHRRFTGQGKSDSAWPPWRSVATKAVIDKRQGIHVTENNYDGRNYITE